MGQFEFCLVDAITYTVNGGVGQAVAAFQNAGFTAIPEVVNHAQGVEAGFIRCGGCFNIEFFSVVDDMAFVRSDGKMPWSSYLRASRRPFALSFCCDDVHACHCLFSERSSYVGALTRPGGNGPAAAETDMFVVEDPLLGAAVSIYSHAGMRIQYLLGAQVEEAANKTDFLHGIDFVSATALTTAEAWARLFDLPITMDSQGHPTILIGPQTFKWIQTEPEDAALLQEDFQSLDAIRLRTTNLSETHRSLISGGFRLAEGAHRYLHESANFTFSIEGA